MNQTIKKHLIAILLTLPFAAPFVYLGLKNAKSQEERMIAAADKISILETENKQLKEQVEKYKASELKKASAKSKTYYPDGTLQSESESYSESQTDIESEKRLQEIIEARFKAVVIVNKKENIITAYATFSSFGDLIKLKPDGGGGLYQRRLIGEWFLGGGLEKNSIETSSKLATSIMW